MSSMVYRQFRNLCFVLSVASFLLTAMAVPTSVPTATSDVRGRNDNVSVDRKRYFQIHPGYDETKCLDVRGSGYADGTSVDM